MAEMCDKFGRPFRQISILVMAEGTPDTGAHLKFGARLRAMLMLVQQASLMKTRPDLSLCTTQNAIGDETLFRAKKFKESVSTRHLWRHFRTRSPCRDVFSKWTCRKGMVTRRCSPPLTQ